MGWQVIAHQVESSKPCASMARSVAEQALGDGVELSSFCVMHGLAVCAWLQILLQVNCAALIGYLMHHLQPCTCVSVLRCCSWVTHGGYGLIGAADGFVQ